MIMKRRDFLKTTAATASALAASGHLPLLAAVKNPRKQRGGSLNIFTEPCAIEPITGHLAGFTPTQKGSMTGPFSATYALIYWNSAQEKSRNSERGSISVNSAAETCKTVEKRHGNTIEGSVQCSGSLRSASSWTLNSSFGDPQTAFTETGSWDGKKMTVKSKSWTQEKATSNPLITKWALLPLLASGDIRKAPLKFDLLDDSTLRPNQEIRYEGVITIPVRGGKAKLHSYVQTGQAIQPTHYLLDSDGRVQLITASFVNWVLKNVN